MSFSYLIFLSKLHIHQRTGHKSIFRVNLWRFKYWQTPKYKGWFSYEDYLDFVTPILWFFISRLAHNPYTFLSDDENDRARRIIFIKSSEEKLPSFLPKDTNPPPPKDPPEYVTFTLLKRQPPQFLQENKCGSFHAHFYCHVKNPSAISSWFHPLEDDDVGISLPWCLWLDEDTSFKLTGDVSWFINCGTGDLKGEPFTRTMHFRGLLLAAMEWKFLLSVLSLVPLF